MRIEIYTNKNGTTINGFYNDFNALLAQSESMIASLNHIKKYSCLVNGEIGSLQSAVDSIDLKIQNEETKKANLIEFQRKCDEFAEKIKNTDNIVSEKVSQNQEIFYSVNEWSRPQIGNWINDAFSWLYSKVKSTNMFAGTAGIIDNDTSNDVSVKFTSNDVSVEFTLNGSGPSSETKDHSVSGSLLSGNAGISTSAPGVDTKVEAKGELVGGSAKYEVKEGLGVNIKKGNIDFGIISGKLDGHLARGSVSGTVDLLDGIGSASLKKEVSLYNYEANGTAGARLWEKGIFNPSALIKGSLSGTALEGNDEVKVGLGNEELYAYTKGKGKFLTADLGLELGFGKIIEGNKTKYGIKYKGRKEAYLAEGTVKNGFNFCGLDIGAGVTAKAGGAGGSLGFDISSEGISVNLGAGLLLGLEGKVDINWSDFDISEFEPENLLPWNWW